MKVACIIVTHNGQPWIVKCVSSVLGSAYATHVIVVDNASTDNTKELVRSFPEVELIELEVNVGFGAANNIGILQGFRANADYFLLLNQDAWIESDTVGQLIEVMEQHPSFGITSPIHWNHNKTSLDPGFSNYLQNGARSLIEDSLRHQLRRIYSVSFVNAAIWLVSRHCIQQIGGFDPLFFMYEEDADYCQRLYRCGLELGIVPCANAFHARAKSVIPISAWQALLFLSERKKSNIIFALKDSQHSLPFLLLHERYRKFLEIIPLLYRMKLLEVIANEIGFVKVLLRLRQVSIRRRRGDYIALAMPE